MKKQANSTIHEINLTPYLAIIKQNLLSILLVTAIFFLAGVVIARQTPPQYHISASTTFLGTKTVLDSRGQAVQIPMITPSEMMAVVVNLKNQITQEKKNNNPLYLNVNSLSYSLEKNNYPLKLDLSLRQIGDYQNLYQDLLNKINTNDFVKIILESKQQNLLDKIASYQDEISVLKKQDTLYRKKLEAGQAVDYAQIHSQLLATQRELAETQLEYQNTQGMVFLVAPNAPSGNGKSIKSSLKIVLISTGLGITLGSTLVILAKRYQLKKS